MNVINVDNFYKFMLRLGKGIFILLILFIIISFFLGKNVYAQLPDEELQKILRDDLYGSSYDDNNDIVLFNYIGTDVDINADVFFPNGYKLGSTYTFFPSIQFVLSDNKWRYLEYATTTQEQFGRLTNELGWWRFFILPFANAQTFYSGAGDGVIRGVSTVFTTAQTTGTGAYPTQAQPIFQYKLSGSDYYVARAFFPFNTSSLDDDICIYSATFSVVCETMSYNDTLTYDIVETFQDDETTLTTADFNDYYETIFSSKYYDQFTCDHSTYNDFSLNSSGKDAISLTDWTLLGLIVDEDLNDSAPSGDNTTYWSLSEETGTTIDPKLIIVTEECSEATSTATSTIDLIDDWYSEDITIIRGRTLHYESSTSAPDYIEIHEYHIPFLFVYFLLLISEIIFFYIMKEFLIRWRS